MTIRLLLADDHAMVRGSLAAFLAGFDDLELVGQATNGAEAVRLCAELQPDVVLMDLMMPEMDGVAATRAILAEHPQTRIIALTSFTEDDLVYRALEAGALGYLLKDDTTDDLVQAIRDAYAGRPSISRDAMQALIRTHGQPAETASPLSEREREVLALMTGGLTNRQIAEKLNLSPSTVKFHVSAILSKLNVASRTEAVALAVQNKLVN